MPLCFTPTPLNHPTQTSSQIPIVTKYVLDRYLMNQVVPILINIFHWYKIQIMKIQNHIYYHALKYTLVIVNTQRLQSGYVKPQ